MLIPAVFSVFMIIAIGLSELFWLPFASNATINCDNGLVLLELLVLDALVELAALLLEPLLEFAEASSEWW